MCGGRDSRTDVTWLFVPESTADSEVSVYIFVLADLFLLCFNKITTLWDVTSGSW